ncbi:hypothetical protein SAMN05421638_1666 [Kaistella treverensis]|uniref:Uncharacterized protein n=1 Tax=Kaistella treverensis TaxID=631455 RepID=A0A1I3MMC9_9FLAO|nr:hypothetical protein [Kaistella treverensis]SFI97885.1 hypothetical protein SAMN05421638_1666 [Kaistella treverensis]
MKIILILLSFLFLTDSNLLHQDTLLKVDENGKIIGLPKEFGIAEFDLDRKYLRINDKEIVFPRCMNYYFNIHKKPNIKLLASWYHSKDIMPYYLNFDISQQNENFGYNILVNLETLELIYINISIEQGTTTYNHKIQLEEYCLDEYKNGINTLK